MKEYNDLNILTAYRKCCENPGYKIGIADITVEKSITSYENTLKMLECEDIYNHVKSCKKSMMGCEIIFLNSSRIRFFKATESVRGFAFCELLVSPELSIEEQRWIRYTEKINYEQYAKIHKKQ